MKLPLEFEKRMRSQMNDSEFELFEKSISEEAPKSFRINSKKLMQSLMLDKVKWCDNAYYLENKAVFISDPLWHAGGYYVQEAGSMFLEYVLKNLKNLPEKKLVLDLCAAPGGKSTLISSFLDDKNDVLISNEVIQHRANILEENILKWGAPNCIVTNNDPKHFSSFKGVFDLVVIDAPCSGEGLFRKDEKSINEWSENNCQLCTERQSRIVHDIWNTLKENGYLVYSTCTYNPNENIENIVRFSKDLSFETIHINIPLDWNIEDIKSNGFVGYQFYPHKTKSEGFFISILKKTSVEKFSFPIVKQLCFTEDKEKNTLFTFVNLQNPYAFTNKNGEKYLFPKSLDFKLLSAFINTLKTKHFGVKLGNIIHGKFIPNHGLALNTTLNEKAFSNYSLSDEEVIKYLKKEPIEIKNVNGDYILMKYKNLPLGFQKKIDRRFNNLFPKEWRILSQHIKEVSSIF